MTFHKTRPLIHYLQISNVYNKNKTRPITAQTQQVHWRTIFSHQRGFAMAGLPHFAKGEVVKGFGRGSKDLGCPTANFPEEVVNQLPATVQTGVYYGFASVDKGPVYKMVMSIGWNPFYKNVKKSMETYILHEFDSDFYGQELRIAILGYIRPEKDFGSLDELKTQINNDIETASKELDRADLAKYKTNTFFTD